MGSDSVLFLEAFNCIDSTNAGFVSDFNLIEQSSTVEEMQLNLSSQVDWSPFSLCVKLVSEFSINNVLNLAVKSNMLRSGRRQKDYPK